LFHSYNRYQLYVFAFYWVCTIVSTTGYGDYTGGTRVEYLFTIFIEFTGVIVFVVLMYLVDNIVSTNSSFTAFFFDKIRQFDIWFTLVEQCKQPKHMSPELYLTMYENISVSMYSDFNILIEEHTFFDNISPRLQTKLIDLMFHDFIKNFSLFFEKMERNLINQIVVNLHARVFQPGQEILKPGKKVHEVFFIVEGQVAICENQGLQEPFCILPRYSYFGEYEVLYNEPAEYNMRALGSEDFDLFETNEFTGEVGVVRDSFY
jgi:hypothetical protein